MQLQARIARYLGAAGPVAIDRSDRVRGAIPESAVDSSEIHGDEASLGGIAQPFDPIYLPGRALMETVRKHEENHATTALLAEHREGIDPQLRAKVALIPSIPYEEYRALLRRRPGAAASPAFLEYEARRDEIHEAEREYLLLMAAARDAKPTRKRARPTTGN